jgi:hypothetical protein
MRERKNVYRIMVGKAEEVDAWITLRWILERWDRVVWTGLIWLRIGNTRWLL